MSSVRLSSARTPSRTSTLSSPSTTRILTPGPRTKRPQGGHVPLRYYHAAMALRVVFAEDNFLVREGTAALLSEVDGVDLVAVVEDLPSLLAAVEEHEPNAVLTDIRMPPTNTREGIEAAHRIRAEHPATGVVVLSQYIEGEYAFDLLPDGAGGLGYLLKERIADLGEVVQALEEVSRGGSVLDPKVVEELVARGRRQGGFAAGVTDRA